MTRSGCLAPLLPLMLCLLASAQYLTYSYSTIVSCGPFLPAPNSPSISTSPSDPNEIHIDMPPCPACDCPTCTAERVYVTTVVALNASSQLTSQVFTVHETYSGTSAIPTLLGGKYDDGGSSIDNANGEEAAPPSYGFTTAEQTCSVAGSASVVTVTYPMTAAASPQSTAGGAQEPAQGKVAGSGGKGKAKVVEGDGGSGDNSATPQQPPPTSTNDAVTGHGVDMVGVLVAIGVSGVLTVLVGF